MHNVLSFALLALPFLFVPISPRVISWDTYAEFRESGWDGPYFESENANNLPAEFQGDVRNLPGTDLWYYYANGSDAQVILSWNVTDSIAESPTSAMYVEYYTSATVTIEPVKDVYALELPNTSGAIWGTNLANTDFGLQSSEPKQILITIMPGPDGYIVFNRITLEYEDFSSTTASHSTTLASSTTEEPIETTTYISTPLTTTEASTTTVSTTEASTTTDSITETETSSITSASTSMSFSTPIVTYLTTEMTTILQSSTTASSTNPTTDETETASTDDPSSTTPTTSPTFPGDLCFPETMDCSNVPYTECIYQNGSTYRCMCITGTDLSENGARCILRAELIGSPCETEKQCLNLPGTECLPNEFNYMYCLCINDTIPSSSRKQCLPLVSELGSACVETIQCTEGLQEAESICTEGICQCSSDHVPSEDKERCLHKLQYGESCQEILQCTAGMGNHADCRENTCTCSQGTGYFKPSCFRIIAIGESCYFNQECALGSNNNTDAVCAELDSRCHCSEDLSLIEWEGLCYDPLVVGDLCVTDTECTVPIMGPVYCDDFTHRCSCSNSSSPVDDGQACSTWKFKASSTLILILIISCLGFVNINL